MLFTLIIIGFVVGSYCYYKMWTDAILGILNSCAILLFGKRSKGNVHPRTGHEGPEGEYGYHCTLSVTLALDRGRWSMPHPGYFASKKETQYPFYRRLGGPQHQYGQERKILPPSGFDPQTPASCKFLYRLCYILLVGRRGNFGTTILDVRDFDTKLIIKH